MPLHYLAPLQVRGDIYPSWQIPYHSHLSFYSQPQVRTRQLLGQFCQRFFGESLRLDRCCQCKVVQVGGIRDKNYIQWEHFYRCCRS